MILQKTILLAEETTTVSTSTSTETTMLLLAIFVLAIYVGVEIITKIPPTLHTPLMSGSNAISGITLIGALVTMEYGNPGISKFLGLLAIVLAMINVVGGFMVTHRMLEMFQPKNKK